MWPFKSSVSSTVASKRAVREQLVANAQPYVAAQHDAYLRATAGEIVRRISSGEWTASGVLEAFIARAALAHATTNCLTEILFDTARVKARELDEEFKKTGKTVGLLHGVPLSLKDQYEVVGYDATVGFTQWVGKPSSSNAETVELLIAQGAIPFVKTNIPQMMAFECSNPLWGRTTNPYNSEYTCGGSSGGEGALLAMDGSVIGMGSDVAGSLRIPSSYCGVFGFKPGAGRVPVGGAKVTFEGYEALKFVLGPMARSVEDIEVALRIIMGASDATGLVAPLPYRTIELPTKLKFGYYTNDGFVKASPACARAVLETVDALRRAGHDCVEIPLPSPVETLQTFNSLNTSDGYKSTMAPLGPDPMEDFLFLLAFPPKLPGFIRSTAAWIIEHLVGDHHFADLVRGARHKGLQEFYSLTARRDELTREYRKEVWEKYGLDGVLAPVQAVPGTPHGAGRDISPLANATLQYNIVESPVGAVPVTRVDPSKDVTPSEWLQASQGSRIVESFVYGGRKPVYDPVAMSGLPVGVQVIGRRWEDEKVVSMMKIVDNVLGERGFGPGAWEKWNANNKA